MYEAEEGIPAGLKSVTRRVVFPTLLTNHVAEVWNYLRVLHQLILQDAARGLQSGEVEDHRRLGGGLRLLELTAICRREEM